MGASAPAFIHANATVESDVAIGAGTSVWARATVRAGATVGRDCVIGQNAFIDTGVVVGDRCKIQNNALVYAPAQLADGVFIGPAAIITNDRHPRAITPEGEIKRANDWEMTAVRVDRGAAIGAGATIVAGVTVGAWATVAAGAVVATDVAAHALVGGVPARRISWVGRSGRRLERDSGVLVDPVTGDRFTERDGGLEPA